MASERNGTLYVGVTSDLAKRIWQHRNGASDGFTKKYQVHRLVYFETFDEIVDAIVREKQLKRFNRGWKIGLIERDNPEWTDLYPGLV